MRALVTSDALKTNKGELVKESRLAVVVGAVGVAVLVSVAGCSKEPAAPVQPVEKAPVVVEPVKTTEAKDLTGAMKAAGVSDAVTAKKDEAAKKLDSAKKAAVAPKVEVPAVKAPAMEAPAVEAPKVTGLEVK